MRKSVAVRHGQTLRKMADAKWRQVDIARELGVSPDTIHRAMKTLGIRYPRATAGVRHGQAIRRMVGDGWTQKRIAAELGMSADTIARAMSELGIKCHWSHRKFNTHPVVSQLRAERVARHLTMKELSRIAGYHKTLMSEWERGARRIHLPALVDVAQALGFEVVLQPRSQ